MWIVCCRKQEVKRTKVKEKPKQKQKYSVNYHENDKHNDDDDGDGDKNCKLKNDINIDVKISSDSYDSIKNGYYPRQERRSLPDVVIPSANLTLDSYNISPLVQRPSLHIDYETGRRPTMLLETTAKLAESESTNLDDNYPTEFFNKSFFNNDLKVSKEENKDIILSKRRAHSLISTNQQQIINNNEVHQSRKSEVVRSIDNGKRLTSTKRLSLFIAKPLKHFRKSKDSIHSIHSQKINIDNNNNSKVNIMPTIRNTSTTSNKMKSSLKRIKHSKLFSPIKLSHENIIPVKDQINHENYSEQSEDSLGQLPTTKNSIFRHLHTRNVDLHHQMIRNYEMKNRHFHDNSEQLPSINSKNVVLRRGSLCIFSQIDEPIVTPFAQILASLRKVRANFIILTNVTSTRDSRFGAVQPVQPTEDGSSSSQLGYSAQNKVTANETLEELEWCLERLENIQTHRSVSDMASSKFKKMLNKELSQFADGGQSGKQISEYICSTFLDSKENDPITMSPSVILSNSVHGTMSGSINSKDFVINNGSSNHSESNTCTPSDVIKNSESKSIESGQVTTTVTTDLIDSGDTIKTTTISSTSSSTMTNTTTPAIILNIEPTSLNKSLSKLSSSLSTSSLKSTNNITADEYNKNRVDDNTGGKVCVNVSIPSFGSHPSPAPHQYYSENEKTNSMDNSQTQISPYVVNSTNPSKLEDILQTSLDLWGINMFEVDQLTTNSLTCIFFNIVQKRNLLQKFAIPERNLLLYMTAVEEKYNDNPYHNRVHAADVVQSTHVLLNAQSLESVFTDLEIFTVLFACAIHDVGHPGVTNQYLINTNDKLAILYNDSSVLENHHLAIAFSLLGQPGHDVFENFPHKQRLSSRRMIIDMVLATDMSKHMSLLADLKTMVETKKVAGSGILTLENYTDRMQILQNMVHCADLSNPAKPLDLYRQWTNRVMEELFRQGDKERELGIEISPMCDRNTATIEKTQVSFIDYIVHPLWETWSDLVYPDAQNILETLEDNREWYFSQINENNINENDE